jgi:uncharacterized protein YwqG
MSFFGKLFGRQRASSEPQGISPRVDATVAALKSRAEACLRLEAGGEGRSRLGGVPDMDGAWPRYEGRPLCCVAQLDLADMRAAGGPSWLPGDGRLLFFYEFEHGSWGMETKDLGSAVVIHQAGTPVAAAEPDDLPDEARFPAYAVSFVQAMSTATEERLGLDWPGLNRASTDALEKALEEMRPPSPAHQVGGYPSPVQADVMETECQDIYRRLGHRGGNVGDWRLLLQLDTDDDAGMMWGDTGMLYFWIREQDARVGDFSKVWTILQCC